MQQTPKNKRNLCKMGFALAILAESKYHYCWLSPPIRQQEYEYREPQGISPRLRHGENVMKQLIVNRTMDQERALYHITDALVKDCTFAGERLISSASTKLAKIGPRRTVKSSFFCE